MCAEAVRGLAAILLDEDPPPSGERAAFTVEGADLAGALAALLDECLYTLEVRGLLAVDADVTIEENVDGTRLSGLLHVAGAAFVRTMVKAVTYHELSVVRAGAAWQARVYFDV